MSQGAILIVGGGIAGLWLCDALRRRGDAVMLVESDALGTGQTIGSQGIIHGGVKYALAGALSVSAANIGEMPGRWRAALAGVAEPDLRAARLRASRCHLWQTSGLRSGLAMLGARLALEVTPETLEPGARPEALRHCPGAVAQLDEPIVDVPSVLAALAARNAGHLVLGEIATFGDSSAQISQVRLSVGGEAAKEIAVRQVVLTAGQGNESLRARVGLASDAMQRRPLHMVMVRGALPELHGHCVDGQATRATITTVRESPDHRIWLVGGLLAEQGVAMTSTALIHHARQEMVAILPGRDWAGLEWATWRVDRAEGATPRGRRPDDVQFRQEGNILTAWPTKFALAPRLADRLLEVIPAHPGGLPAWVGNAPRPMVAKAPWDGEVEWTRVP